MNVSEAEAQEFIAKNHKTILGTIRSSGMPQLTNVASTLVDGKIEISTRAPSAKVRNIRRDPRVTLSILDSENWYKYIVIYGTAEIVGYPEAGPELRKIYQAIAGEHPNWEEYDQAMVDEDRVVLRITIDKMVA